MINDRLDIDVIRAGLKTKRVGQQVVVYESTASTNDLAWEYGRSDENNGTCVFAELQTSGRGRLGNKWLSRRSESILCSILLMGLECDTELLTIASALAVAEAVGGCGKANVRIKWPNDIMINGRKIAGILLESRITNGRCDYVIGVGINCHQDQKFFDGAGLEVPGTSVDIANDIVVDRNELSRSLLCSFDKCLAIAESDGERVINSWQQLSALLGRRIEVEANQERFAGNCIGVDPAKGLILRLDSGAIRMFEASYTTIVKR